MAFSPVARRRARYLVPVGAAVVTAAFVVLPQAASGAQHPNLPRRTAAQLLASLERAKLPQFSGTVVETARLGLPNIGDSSLANDVTPAGASGLSQLVTLLTGSHTAQIAYGGPDRQRVAIFLSNLSETDVVHNGRTISTYSSDSNSVTHTVLKSGGDDTAEPDETTPVNPDKAAEQALAEIDPSTRVTIDRTAEVAGRPAYQLDLTPRDPRTLVGSVRIAIDSATSMPLRVELWSRKTTSTPAFSVGFTSISMSPPSASTFDFTTPPGATTTPQPFSRAFASPDEHDQAGNNAEAGGTTVLGKNWTSVFVDTLSDTPVQGGPSASGVGGSGGIGSSSSAAPGSTVVRPGHGAVKAGNGAVPPDAGPSAAQELDQLGTPVAEGHLIATSLLSILVTPDNRILVGAVTPAYIEQLAAGKAVG
jgi:outer membrane lipoprotein-sorting protein